MSYSKKIEVQDEVSSVKVEAFCLIYMTIFRYYARDTGSIPGSGGSPGKGYSNPL